MNISAPLPRIIEAPKNAIMGQNVLFQKNHPNIFEKKWCTRFYLLLISPNKPPLSLLEHPRWCIDQETLAFSPRLISQPPRLQSLPRCNRRRPSATSQLQSSAPVLNFEAMHLSVCITQNQKEVHP